MCSSGHPDVLKDPRRIKALDGRVNALVQSFGSDVCAVRPDDGAEIRIDTHLFEVGDIAHWFKNRTAE